MFPLPNARGVDGEFLVATPIEIDKMVLATQNCVGKTVFMSSEIPWQVKSIDIRKVPGEIWYALVPEGKDAPEVLVPEGAFYTAEQLVEGQ